MLESQIQSRIDSLAAKLADAKSQFDNMQPMIGMTSLKSPGETGEYKAFEKIMQP